MLPWRLRAGWLLRLKLPCPHHSTSFPMSRTSCPPPAPQPHCFCFPASLQNYLNKPIISPCRNQGSPHPLVTTEPASHSPYLLSLLPSATQHCITSYLKKKIPEESKHCKNKSCEIARINTHSFPDKLQLERSG